MWNFEAVFLKTSSGQLLPRNFGSYWFTGQDWVQGEALDKNGIAESPTRKVATVTIPTFLSVGKILKSRRVHDYHDTMESYFSVGGSADNLEKVEDPADADQVLNSRLNSQSEEGKKKMDQVNLQYNPMNSHKHSKQLHYTRVWNWTFLKNSRKLKTQGKNSNSSKEPKQTKLWPISHKSLNCVGGRFCEGKSMYFVLIR